MDSLVLNWIALFSILSHFCPQAASGSIWWKHNILVFGSSLLFPPNTPTAQIIRWIHDGDRFIKFWSLAQKEAGKEAHYSSCSVGNEALNNRQKCLEVLVRRGQGSSQEEKNGKMGEFCQNRNSQKIHLLVTYVGSQLLTKQCHLPIIPHNQLKFKLLSTCGQ